MPEQDVVRIARMFDVVADTYDSVGVDFFLPIAASLVRAMPPIPGERWWDIGCGRGAVIDQVAPTIGPRGTVIGSDISRAMLDHARSHADRSGWGNVRLVHDDAQDPSRPPGEVDTISSSLVLFFLPDPALALTRWIRALRRGGRIGVTTFGPMDPRWRAVDDVFDPFLPPALRDARTAGANGPFASDSGVESLLRSAGFQGVGTVTDDIPVVFADSDQWHAFTWSTGQRAMWLAVPEDRRADVRRQAEQRLVEVAADDGSISFRQAIRHTVGIRP